MSESACLAENFEGLQTAEVPSAGASPLPGRKSRQSPYNEFRCTSTNVNASLVRGDRRHEDTLHNLGEIDVVADGAPSRVEGCNDASSSSPRV